MVPKRRFLRSTFAVTVSLLPLAGLVSPVFAQAPAAVDIAVDATQTGTPLERVWPFYGYDEVNYTTTPPGGALLKALAKMNAAPVHVRGHFLLNSGDGTASLKWGSTNAYTEDVAGNPVYNWTLMDGILDAITGAGALPLNEIAFMPHDLSTRPDPYKNSSVYALDGGCFYPPKDYTKWGDLIAAWATHVKARYPNAENTWQWELWNEPDIGYWHGTFAEYAKMYDFTEASLHQVLPAASLGGPAVANAGSNFLKQFLAHCATGTNAVTGKTGTRLDMVSFHAKGGVAITGGHVEMNLGHQLQLHRDGFNAIAAVPMFKTTPIVISEADPDGCAACPASQTPADAYRNSPAYGAYEVAMMKRTLELEARIGVKVRGLVTWAFLFTDAAYFPGYRTLQANGIDLPVLNAFKLLGGLDGNRLPAVSGGARSLDDILANSVRTQPDVDALATRNGRQIQILVWNYHDDLVMAAASPVRLTVKLPPDFGTSAVVTRQLADETHGDAYTVWTAQGKPATPTLVQIQALKDAMQPVLVEPAHTVAAAAGSIGVDFDLARFGVSLITVAPVGFGDASVDDAPGGAATGGPDAGAPEASGGTPGPIGLEDSAGMSSSDAAAAAGTGGAGAAAPNSGADGGCSCRLPRVGRTPNSSEWIVVAGLAFLGVRRIRQARSTSTGSVPWH